MPAVPVAPDRRAWVALGVTVALFGTAWPVTRAALADATPLWFAVGRAGGGAAVAAAALVLAGRLRPPGRGDLPAVLTLGLIQLGAFFALAHLGVARVPAGRTAVLTNVLLPWLVPLSVLVLGERVSPRRWAAAGIALAGAAVLAGPWSVDWSAPGTAVGHGLLLLAALCWSVAIVATKRWPPRRPVVELLPWTLGLGALALVPPALLLEPDGGVGPGAWPHLAYIGLLVSPLGTWSAIEAGRRLPGAVAAMGFLLAPVLGFALSARWLGEAVGTDVALGGLLIAASVALAARGDGPPAR